ncbi:hypothetical protein F4782DRAFT_527762 [Xylaria castorea]|nr:hypothetical protein F4782DRAFT_527762 [Xylaria castorea]
MADNGAISVDVEGTAAVDVGVMLAWKRWKMRQSRTKGDEGGSAVSNWTVFDSTYPESKESSTTSVQQYHKYRANPACGRNPIGGPSPKLDGYDEEQGHATIILCYAFISPFTFIPVFKGLVCLASTRGEQKYRQRKPSSI